MTRKIFVNLPVAHLPKSMAFFEALGFKFNPQFTDETAACMIVSDDIFVMLLTHDKFRQFTPKAIADARQTSEVLTCISLETRAMVDDVLTKAKAGGGHEFRESEDHGFMYHRSFSDLDGHIWEVVWLDPAMAGSQ